VVAHCRGQGAGSERQGCRWKQELSGHSFFSHLGVVGAFSSELKEAAGSNSPLTAHPTSRKPSLLKRFMSSARSSPLWGKKEAPAEEEWQGAFKH
jgi:hypothetical protein